MENKSVTIFARVASDQQKKGTQLAEFWKFISYFSGRLY